ncbi:MAG: DegT/DnrJ/EryC1/StrS family aminotransferase [Comamonadaceae bacterium]|nr:DegT/DnrJ/EryC1/StrS family aminotransferase [Comamonadaceae bacterium]
MRYGNVMGSRGSVIPFFLSIRDNGRAADHRRAHDALHDLAGAGRRAGAGTRSSDMVGGEIYVRKIPSMKVTDVARRGRARRAARDRRHPPRREAARADDQSRGFASTPTSTRTTTRSCRPSTAGIRAPNGSRTAPRCPRASSYASDNNREWMSVADLQALDRRSNRNKIGAAVSTIPYGRPGHHRGGHRRRRRRPALGLPDPGTRGPRVRARTAHALCEAPHAVAVHSATAALHMACLALGLGPGDRLWTTPNTFVASANCRAVLRRHAWTSSTSTPRRCNLSVPALRRSSSAPMPKAGCRRSSCRCTSPVSRCDMREIRRARRSATASRSSRTPRTRSAARYLGEPVGSGRHSDITVFSFHPVKIVTTGRGRHGDHPRRRTGRHACGCCAATASPATRREWTRRPTAPGTTSRSNSASTTG